MVPKSKPRIGIIGVGRLGSTLARALLGADYNVWLASSKEPAAMELITKVLLPGAVATTVEGAVHHSDVVILAIPLYQYTTLDPALFKDKIVIDAMNYWPATEGHIAVFEQPGVGSSEFLQSYLANTRLVKTLNHIAYGELYEHAQPHGHVERRAIALAGDDAQAKEVARQLIIDIGFDPVDLGPLTNGRLFQPNTPLFNAQLNADKIQKLAYGQLQK